MKLWQLLSSIGLLVLEVYAKNITWDTTFICTILLMGFYKLINKK